VKYLVFVIDCDLFVKFYHYFFEKISDYDIKDYHKKNSKANISFLWISP